MKKIGALIVCMTVCGTALFAQTTADEWYEKAGEYHNSGDYTNAVTAYSETVKRDRSHLNAYLNRGIVYYLLKNYDAAIADYDTFMNGASDFPLAYVLRGDAYGAKSVYHKAVADYRTGFEKGYEPSDSTTVDKSSKADMWFCGAMYMEITINRFLGKADVVTAYENRLKTVCDKNSITRAEVETFYRQNIGALIAGVVDEEFGKVRFLLKDSPNGTYGVLLSRNTQNQYILRYEGYFNDTKATKTLPPASLGTLLDTMRRNPVDFNQASIDQVRTQAALIPSVALAVAGTADAFVGTIKKALTDFYLTPMIANYNTVKDIHALFMRKAWEYHQDPLFGIISSSYVSVLSELSSPLVSKVDSDTNQEKYAAASLTQAQIRALTVRR
jgi:hypothetical protein